MPWWVYFGSKTISLLGLSVIEKSTRWPSLWFLVVSSQILRLQAKIDYWCVKTSRLWVFVGLSPYYIIWPTPHSKWGPIQGQLISCGKRAINFYDRGLDELRQLVDILKRFLNFEFCAGHLWDSSPCYLAISIFYSDQAKIESADRWILE